MNFDTLAGVYSTGKRITRILGADQNVTQLAARLKVLATNPHPNTVAELTNLAVQLDALDQHLRAMGGEEMVALAERDA